MQFNIGKATVFFTTSIDDKDGKPHGFIWLTTVVIGKVFGRSFRNTRWVPIGWCK